MSQKITIEKMISRSQRRALKLILCEQCFQSVRKWLINVILQMSSNVTELPCDLQAMKDRKHIMFSFDQSLHAADFAEKFNACELQKVVLATVQTSLHKLEVGKRDI